VERLIPGAAGKGVPMRTGTVDILAVSALAAVSTLRVQADVIFGDVGPGSVQFNSVFPPSGRSESASAAGCASGRTTETPSYVGWHD